MAKLLRKLKPKRNRAGIPSEAERWQIIQGLLKIRHFHGIWYNGMTISVRRFCGGMGGYGEPEYLSWSEARAILETATAPVTAERKPLSAEDGSRVIPSLGELQRTRRAAQG